MKKYVKPSLLAMGIGVNHSLSKACPKSMEAFCGILYRM